MMLWCVISCLLLRIISSAPLSSDTDPWLTSSSDEDPQLPAVFPVVGGASQQAPPSLIMKVKDTEKNLTLSFAIFILPVEEEGSAMDGGGRSEGSSRGDDVSSEEYSSQDFEPITTLHPSGDHDDSLMVSVVENPSSEEMMNDQPELTFPGDEFHDYNNTFNRKYWNQRPTLSEDSDSSNKSTETHPLSAGPIDDYVLDKRTTSDKSVSFSSPQNESPDRRRFGASDKFVKDGVSSRSGSISKGFGFGLNFSNVFGSIQEVMEMLSGNQGGFRGTASHHKRRGATLDSGTGRLVGLGVSSEESDESLETVSFSRVGSDSKPLSSVSPDPDSKGKPTFSFQSSSDPSNTLIYDLASPGSDSREVQDTFKGLSLIPVSPDQDVSTVVLKIPKQTMPQIHNQNSTKFLPQVGVSLTSDSSEESFLGLTSSGPGLSRAGSLEDSSSSEEVLLAMSSSDSSESEDQTSSSDSGFKPPELGPGNHSQSADLRPNPERLSPGSGTNFNSTSMISKDESAESQTPKTPKEANQTASRTSSSDVSMGLEHAEVDLSSVHDTGTVKDPTSPTSPPTETVSSGASSDAITDTGSDVSAEEEDSSKETDSTDSAVNLKPTLPTRADASANIEKKQTGSDVYSKTSSEANSLGQNQPASNKENIASPPPRPPRRKKPYRFGSLGPISYSQNIQPVARETASEEKFASLVTNTRGHFKALQQHPKKQHVHSGPRHTFFNGNSGRQRHLQKAGRQPIKRMTRFSLAKVANPDQSSSEETK